ncbi:hypothetical protein AXF42_Ash019792 [Apostasia shenzhenica]|uniref:Uncharacterized protein n=1 Tax=Apostasia shenzhenica TaxID=1088818 RepID=A0A2I0AA42_9ASPA|nr:hypothetical protein AXF42_Ash019792 [Apostasia shenzhenica]
MAGEGTLKNLERLKGQNWPLKDFLRHIKNDIFLYAKSLEYVIFKEVVPSPGAVLMKKARRGQSPAIQLNKKVTKAEEEQVMEVPEPVCGGAAVNVVSSPDDAIDDRKTLTELMGVTGKGKELATAAEPKVIPKSDKGIVIREERERNKAEGGQEEKIGEGAGSPCLDLVLSVVLKKKRGSSESASPEPPSKKGRGAKEEGFAVEGGHDWQQSTEPPYSTNFMGVFRDEGSRIVVRIRGDERKLTIISLPSVNQNCIYRGKAGLAMRSGLVSKELEEKLEKTSTPELYAGFANRMATIRIISQILFLDCLILECTNSISVADAWSLTTVFEQGPEDRGAGA